MEHGNEIPDVLTPDAAKQLLNAVPPKPARILTAVDHVAALATIIASFSSGLLALCGHPWLALVPALIAFLASHHWLASRQRRTNEPRYKGSRIIVIVFGVWMLMPIREGFVRGNVADLSADLLLAGLAPALWLGYYIYLLVRR